MPQKNKQSNKVSKTWIIILIIVVVMAGCVGLIAHYRDTSNKTPAPTGPVTKGEVPSTNSTSSGVSKTTTQNKSTSSATATTTQLLAPTGTFVSNHHPDLSGSPAPNSLASTCTTTPGATCQITFTLNGTVKSLSKMTTDAQGSAYWNWTLQGVGLTTGSWTVKAIATLNGNSQTSTDPQELLVSQ